MKIEILDAVECKVSKTEAQLIYPLLSFEGTYRQQGPSRTILKTYTKDVFSHKGKNDWFFYTGLLPRIKKWCTKNNIPIELIGEELHLPRQRPPILKGIEFREDQIHFINTACDMGRGLLIAPTQTGKTVVFLGVISCYPKLRFLILSHTATIVHQTYERLQSYGFDDVEVFGGGVKVQNPTKRITVSTIQSFAKLDPATYSDYYDAVFVDEVHRVSKQVSQYKQVLGTLLAPIRFGFTATPKSDPESLLTYEGLIGPIIARLSIQEATKADILEKPNLKLIRAKAAPGLKTVYKYQDTYEKINQNGVMVNGERLEIGAYSAGIAENQYRNQQIAEVASKNVENKKITFIFVTYTIHGTILQELIYEKCSILAPFVEGSTSMKERDRIKQGLTKKQIPVCIATVAWMEGLTVKTVTDLILAGGGKSELQLLQKAGRVLANRNVTITDFLDLDNRHLIAHTGERLAVYSEKEWL